MLPCRATAVITSSCANEQWNTWRSAATAEVIQRPAWLLTMRRSSVWMVGVPAPPNLMQCSISVNGMLQEQEADFAPFIEDDGQFAKHCKSMRQVGAHHAHIIRHHVLSQLCHLQLLTEIQNAGPVCLLHSPEGTLKPRSDAAGGMSCSSTHCLLQDGTWAGQHELVAVARMLPAELRIYQAGQPSWTISSGVTSGKAGGPLHIGLAQGLFQVHPWPGACCKQNVHVSKASAAAPKTARVPAGCSPNPHATLVLP